MDFLCRPKETIVDSADAKFNELFYDVKERKNVTTPKGQVLEAPLHAKPGEKPQPPPLQQDGIIRSRTRKTVKIAQNPFGALAESDSVPTGGRGTKHQHRKQQQQTRL